MFKALVLNQENRENIAQVKDLEADDLPEEQVLVNVEYSSINYKDALAVTGKGKIVRGDYPFVPGIDLAGEVVESTSELFTPGDRVIGNGWGLGEAHWGGYSQLARVKPESLVPCPETLSAKHAMALGTAGFTAMLSFMTLQEHGVQPESGEVVITGATGGVGSIGIVLLAQAGYQVVASTGKTSSQAYLQELGAARVIGRDVLGNGPARALDKGLWAGAIDSVGGPALAAILSQMGRHGSVASCGLANSASLETTVFPFILRGVNLLGIDSSTCDRGRRIEVWERLAAEFPRNLLDELAQTVSLTEIPAMSEEIMASKIQGRIVVDIHGA